MKNLIITFFYLINLSSFCSFSQTQLDSYASATMYILEDEILQSWDYNSSLMINDWKSEYIYDSNGQTKEYISSNWEEDEWKNEAKINFAYDTNGYLEQTKEYSWHGNQLWFPNRKTEYTHDINGNLSQDAWYDWNGRDWKQTAKAEYFYDSNERRIKDIYYSWYQGQWILGSETEYTYDNDMLIRIDFMIEHWDDYRVDYSYDTIGNLVQTTLYVNGHVSSKTEYTYDEYGNPLQRIQYSGNGNTWVNHKKDEYTYDNSFSFLDLILPYFYNHIGYSIVFNTQLSPSGIGGFEVNVTDLFFRHMLTNRTEYEWNENSNSWDLSKSYDYLYSETEILSISELDPKQIKIYPNPVSTELNLQLNNGLQLQQVQLYNIVGQLVKNSHEPHINVSNLNHGLYLVKIEIDKGEALKKIIIK